MPAIQLPNGKVQFLDANGDPLAGGSVFLYIPNTTTFKNSWIDPNFATLNTNPIILDAAGEAIIFGNGQYRQVVLDVLGNLIWDQITQGFYTGFSSGVTINPTLFTGSGTLANANCTMLYYAYSSVDTLFLRAYVTINIITNGSAGTFLTFTLPFATKITMGWVGVKTGTSASPILFTISEGGTIMKVSDSAGNYPGADGLQFNCMIDYPLL